MTALRSYGADEIAALAPMEQAIDALRDCFAQRPAHIARSAHPAAGGEFMLMPAVADNVAGVKLLMIQPNNAAVGEPVIQGPHRLFDATPRPPGAPLDRAAPTKNPPPPRS